MDTAEEANVQRNLLRHNLQLQLDEFQMLSAIFCNPGELHMDDYGCIDNLTGFVAGDATVRLHTKLDYRFNLPLLEHEKVQVLVELPHLYPSLEMPRVVVRSAVIPRDQERELVARIEQFIDQEIVERSEPYVYQIVCWIQDNFLQLLESVKEPTDNDCPPPTVAGDLVSAAKRSTAETPLVFERLWIYSHHLKSRSKRQTIVKTARDLELTGFSRPGKPGIICVEGPQPDTQEFWRAIKSLRWQKIQIKLSETSAVKETRFADGFREELFCEADDDSDDGEDHRMSMSLFMKFLDKHACGHIKQELFGFQGSAPVKPAC
ncbi:RWD domain-containing protein 2A [Anopheles bellator]|uniref:RWD domain-containing protein 2A n=1 Tax=Anopheles bellator TaxID=139047 RepID=UPI00264880FA|nr:RWD domain-containing protein 2A [Anopheles bellator]